MNTGVLCFLKYFIRRKKKTREKIVSNVNTALRLDNSPFMMFLQIYVSHFRSDISQHKDIEMNTTTNKY